MERGRGKPGASANSLVVRSTILICKYCLVLCRYEPEQLTYSFIIGRINQQRLYYFNIIPYYFIISCLFTTNYSSLCIYVFTIPIIVNEKKS